MGAAAGVFTASDNGILIYQSVQGTREGARLEWFSRNGKKIGQIGDEAEYVSLRISPDARLVAVNIVDHASGMGDIWIFDVARGIRTRFTFDPGDDTYHVWTPNGDTVFFASNRGEQYNLYRKTVGQTGEPELLYESPELKFPLDCSPDGTQLLFAQIDDTRFHDLWVMPLSGDATPSAFIQTPFSENNARFSPDGKWVVYTSDESGRDEIYVTSFPDRAATTQVTMNGGAYVWWRNDGKEIIYQTFRGEVNGVEIDITGDMPVVGAEALLFKATPPFDLYPTIHPTPDGQRFLSIARTAERASAPLTVAVNWTTVLKP
jgi:Tol biopolymer transport system component